jgi:hypothetical protein
MLYGYAPFSPAHRPTVREAVLEDLDDDLDEDEREVVIDAETENLLWDYAGKHAEEFLRKLSPFLTEPFVVQTVGHEKCRFPHVGYQYRVDPDGEMTISSWDEQSARIFRHDARRNSLPPPVPIPP